MVVWDAMSVVHLPAASLESLVAHRRRTGTGRLDECWEGVWHLTDPTARHQQIAGRLYRIHSELIEDAGRGTSWISINVTDREENWIENHRCPDGAVILNENAGRWLDPGRAAFLGGPDLVLEVSSQDEEPYAKFPFYGRVGVREVLIVDQVSGRPELWRWGGEDYREAAPGKSFVTGLEYALEAGCLEVRDASSGRTWRI